MTSSFGISPQRQVRTTVAQPKAPLALPQPAAPTQRPQQVGGQLLYAASFQEDKGAKQTIAQIQDFLKEGGLFDQSEEIFFENYKREKKKQAEDLIASEATAYRDSLQNAKETKALKEAGDFELARQNQLQNPWVNHFYYDAKASNAGKEVAIGLASWGKRNESRLAKLPVEERAAESAAEVERLMAPFGDLPEAYVSAKVDPLVSATLFDLKQSVIGVAEEQKREVDERTALEKFNGNLRIGAKFIEGSLGSAPGLVLGQQAVQKAYDDLYDHLVTVRGYDEKDANALLFQEAGRLFIDLDGDRFNDIGSAYGLRNILDSFQNIKTKDGQYLLQLRNDKGQTLQDVITAGATQAVKRNESFYAEMERSKSRFQKGFKRKLIDKQRQWFAENPEPNDDAIIQQRRELRRALQDLSAQDMLPEDFDPDDIDKLVVDLYPFTRKDISPETSALLLEEADTLIAQGHTTMPAELRQAAEGTGQTWTSILQKFAKARENAGSPEYKAAHKYVLDGLLEGLEGNFAGDKEYQKNKAINKDKRLDQALKNAVVQGKARLTPEASVYIRTLLNDTQKTKDISDPIVQADLLAKAKIKFYGRPEFNDVDAYFDVTNQGTFGKPVAAGPVLGTSYPDDQGRWTINIDDTDNRASWAVAAQPYFVNKDPKIARDYLSNNFVFTGEEMEQIQSALSTGNFEKIDAATRRSIVNAQNGFGNKITIAEMVQKQASRYFGGNVPPEFRANALGLERALRVASAGGGTKPTDTSFIPTNWHHSHSDNHGVDFVIERQNGQIANPVPAPFKGKVVYVGYDKGGFGYNIVIKATQNGPGYINGDHVRLAHLAKLEGYQIGDSVNQGDPVGMSGDDSPMNSVEGRSATGRGTGSHVHIQLYRPTDFLKKYQYGQQRQNLFVRQTYLPLFGGTK